MEGILELSHLSLLISTVMRHLLWTSKDANMPKLAKWNFSYIQGNVDSVVCSPVRVRLRERLQHLILMPVSKCMSVFMCYHCVCMCVFGISRRGANIRRMDSSGCYTQECLFSQRLLSSVLLCSFSMKNYCFFFIFCIFFSLFGHVLNSILCSLCLSYQKQSSNITAS